MFYFNRYNTNIKLDIEKKKVVINMIWLVTGSLFRLVVSILIIGYIARTMGPGTFGVWSYVLAVVAIFSVLGNSVLDNLLVRDLVIFSELKDKLIGSVFVLKIFGGILVIICSLIYGFWVGNDTLILGYIFVYSLSFLIRSLTTIGLIFETKVQSKYNVIVSTITFIISNLLYIILLWNRVGLIWFFTVSIVEALLSVLGTIYYYKKTGELITKLGVSKTHIKRLVTEGFPILLSSVFIQVYSKIDQVMIGNMLNSNQLGLYAGAVKLCDGWDFIYIALITSVYPALIYSRKANIQLYRNRLQLLISGLLIISGGVALIITLFSKTIILTLYGNDYFGSIIVLQIYIWSVVFAFIVNATNRYLILESKTKLVFYRTLLGAVLNIVLNLILIPKIGITGAAMATLISYFVTVVIVIYEDTGILRSIFYNMLNLPLIFNLVKKEIYYSHDNNG